MNSEVLWLVLVVCAAELALLVEGLGVVTESHLEEWLVKPAEEDSEYEQFYSDDNQIKLFAPDESVSWVASPIVDDWGHSGPLARSRSDDWSYGSAIPKVDPMVSLIGSFQGHSDMNGSHDDELYKHHEHWTDEESGPGTPRFGTPNGYYSETDVGMVRDQEDHLQQPLLGGSNYETGRYGNTAHRGLR